MPSRVDKIYPNTWLVYISYIALWKKSSTVDKKNDL